MRRAFIAAIACLAPLSAHAKTGAFSLRLGAGAGAGSGAVQIGDGDGDAAYTFRNKNSMAWLQIGAVHSAMIASDFGFFGSKQILTSDYQESSRVSTDSSGKETLQISGGGFLYSLNILMGAGSEVAFYTALGVGGFNGTLNQSGDTEEDQSYSSGIGGCFDAGFIFGTGEAWSKSHLELFLGGQSLYTSLTSGKSSDGRTLSDIYVGTLSWLAALSIKI
jgi:hypothetical protein